MTKLPECRNPQHPAGMPKQMIFLEEKDNALVFACQACKDVNRKLSVQIVTTQAYKRVVHQQLKAQGRLMTKPPEIRRPQMCAPPKMRMEWDSDHRRSKDGKYELVTYRDLGEGNLQIQMAVDGVLAPMMDDHIASREQYPTDQEYFTRLAQASELMIHLYGDARSPLSEDEVQQRQQQGF
jgi:hypothetical protein